MRAVLALILWSVGLGLALAQSPAPQAKAPVLLRTEILSVGEFASTPIERTEDAPGTVSGILYVPAANPALLKPTTDVSLFVGVMFGMIVRAPDLPAGESVPVTVRTTSPPVPTPDGRIVHGSTWESSLGAEPSFVGLCASKDWHLVPGTYSIALLHEGRVIASQTFTVTVGAKPDGREPCLAAPAVS